MIKVAINGFGRIGRNILRAFYEKNYRDKIKIVAINDTGNIETNAHLLQYDSVHGRFSYPVSYAQNKLNIEKDSIHFVTETNPTKLPWHDLQIDVVLECTGRFTSRKEAESHIQAGAKKVIISAPAKDQVDATIVYGVNHKTLKSSDKIISNASCTTNCLAPLVKPIHTTIGIESGLMNTIHAYTNDQALVDSYHSDLRRARAAALSLIPTKTGAAAAVGLVLPELAGKLDGYAIRVPTSNVSVVDFTFIAKRETSIKEINDVMKLAASNELKGILAINELPLVSIDFNHNDASSIFDTTQTKVIGKLVKVLAWYDNEWGFSNRMLDTTIACHQA